MPSQKQEGSGWMSLTIVQTLHISRTNLQTLHISRRAMRNQGIIVPDRRNRRTLFLESLCMCWTGSLGCACGLCIEVSFGGSCVLQPTWRRTCQFLFLYACRPCSRALRIPGSQASQGEGRQDLRTCLLQQVNSFPGTRREWSRRG